MSFNKKQKSYLILFVMFIILTMTIIFSYLFIYKKRMDAKSHETVNEAISYLLTLKNKEVINSYENNIYYDKYMEYFSEFENNNYTYKKPYIVVNPFDNVKGSILVMFKTNKKESSTLKLVGKNNDDLNFSIDNENYHIYAFAGLYPGNNKIIINDNYSFDITNDEYDLDNKFDINSDRFINLNDGVLSIYDGFGFVRWKYLNKVNDYKILENKHLLIYEEDKTYEIDLLGYIYKEYYTLKDVPTYDVEKTNIIEINKNKYDINKIIGKQVNVSSYKTFKDYFIIYLKDEKSFIKIGYDEKIKWVIGNVRKPLVDKKLYLKTNKQYLPDSAENIYIKENEIYFINNNKIYKYIIDKDKLSYVVKTSPKLEKKMDFIDYNAKYAYNELYIYEFDDEYNIINKEIFSGIKKSIDLINYNYLDIPKIELVSSVKKIYVFDKLDSYNKYLKSKNKNVDITLYDNILSIPSASKITLISTKGFISEIKCNEADLSYLQDNKYFIFITMGGKIYNTLKYIELKGDEELEN